MSWQGLNFDFTGVVFDGGNFTSAEFTGGEVSFDGAMFSGGGEVRFDGAEFTGGRILFNGARFAGGTVDFSRARFAGGTVDFRQPADWSHPPSFDWEGGTPPQGVKLPELPFGTGGDGES